MLWQHGTYTCSRDQSGLKEAHFLPLPRNDRPKKEGTDARRPVVGSCTALGGCSLTRTRCPGGGHGVRWRLTPVVGLSTINPLLSPVLCQGSSAATGTRTESYPMMIRVCVCVARRMPLRHTQRPPPPPPPRWGLMLISCKPLRQLQNSFALRIFQFCPSSETEEGARLRLKKPLTRNAWHIHDTRAPTHQPTTMMDVHTDTDTHTPCVCAHPTRMSLNLPPIGTTEGR